MDFFPEDLTRPEDMTRLTNEDGSKESVDNGDEVDHLQHSFLEAVQDDNIQPKMQCLMMDSSFSMVTMQGEDSGIEWETTSTCNMTPWTSEAGHLPVDLNTSATGAASPGITPAGKIIFVMDEELISRQMKSKERKGKADIHKEFVLSTDDISGRPELVGVSQPNVKADDEKFEENVCDFSAGKEQKLFRLVSEGSEILNIIVPSKVVTVDEEESQEMTDNLSYLEASHIVKAQEEVHDEPPPANVSASIAATVTPSMDPPGAPVPRPTTRERPSNVDYFEAFALIEAQAPGGPTVSEHGQNESADTLRTTQSEVIGACSNTLSLNEEDADRVSLVELTSELLDDVFYGTTDGYSKTTDKAGKIECRPSRLSLKTTGATLFGSQEDILTPIYLPEGPPKIIDPILLEEPKAMAFLYTDLYEEAMGSRKKDEDTESLSSEKSFHSRHSDREARGYLEKYVLIDETPVLEVETKNHAKEEESQRILTQDLYEFRDMVSKPDPNPFPDSEEVTDFFRSSASSSPCVLELSPFAESDGVQSAKKDEAKPKKKVVITVETEPDLAAADSLEDFLDDTWESGFEDATMMEKEETALQHKLQQTVVPPPPRRKALSCLDLAPLTPAIIRREEADLGMKEVDPGVKEKGPETKETQEEEKEMAEEVEKEEAIPFDDSVCKNAGLEADATVSATNDGNATFRDIEETLEPSESEKSEEASKESMDKEMPQDQAKGKRQCVIL